MAATDPADEDTIIEYRALMVTDGVSEQHAAELATGLCGAELRMLIAQQRATESGESLTRRLLAARHDPRLLAGVLLRAHTVHRGWQVVLSTLCLGLLVWALVQPLLVEGPVPGLLLTLGAVVLYLLLRPLAKRVGYFSAGVFTVDREGVLRLIAGLGRARQRLRQGGEGPARRFAFAAAFLVVCLGLPVTIAVWADLPQVMLCWLVLAMLALNEVVLLTGRTYSDVRRRCAVVIFPELGLELVGHYLTRGGDPRRLIDGISVDELLPAEEAELTAMMNRAVLRYQLTRAG